MMTMAEQTLTPAIEDYLKAIYKLQLRYGRATNSLLADELGIARPSISGMLHTLAERGLITYEPYRGVCLTEAGNEAALRLIRRHRLIETFLATNFDMPWDEVHQEAEKLEHAVSDQVESRMDVALGHPTTDPHGAPIPARDGSVIQEQKIQLDALKVGQAGIVAEVCDHDPELLRYLAKLGIGPGVEVHLVEVSPFGGPLTLRVESTLRQLGPQAAAYVWLKKVWREGEQDQPRPNKPVDEEVNR